MDQNDDGVLYFELIDDKGTVIARLGDISNFPEKFTIQSKENFSEGDLRNVFRSSIQGSVQIILNKKHKLFQGNKAVRRVCSVYLTLIPKFKLIHQSQRQSSDAVIRRFAHNLIKFQKRFKDNFNRLIPDKYRGGPYVDFKEEVSKRIATDIDAAADDVCQMSHRALDLDAQIETLRIIAGYADNTGSPLPTNIKKAMFRLTNPFVEELKRRNININIDIDTGLANRNKVNVVHGLFNAAIWQLFDNICKYTLDDTDINISADLGSAPKCLTLNMVSVTIDEDEKEKIFLENQQGRNVKQKDKTGISQGGTGIGLYIVRKALGLMKAKIGVVNHGFVVEKHSCPYSKHSFNIEFCD